MDSINQNQPEDNRDDLRGGDAVEKIRALVDKAQTCFFCTNDSSGDSGGARPMNVRKVDEEGTFWFLCASDSHVAKEVEMDPRVTLYFQGSPHSDFMQISGHATLSTDKAMIKELWEPMIKTWFTEGEDDPRIRVIRLAPNGGYYWDTKHGGLVAGVKIMIGAMIGKTLDDSIEGTLRV